MGFSNVQHESEETTDPRFLEFNHTDDWTTNFKPANLFSLGLVGGYQHYFGQSQRQGIKISAHIYSGLAKWYDTDTMTGENYDGSTSTETFNETLSYVPIQSGIDIKYLWDFFEMGKHTLGLNVGVGYEFDYYIGDKDKFTYSTISSNPKLNENGGDNKGMDSEHNIFSSGFYPVVGLHYYYGHHQFEALYRFGGLISLKGQSKKMVDNQIAPPHCLFYDSTLHIKSNNYFTFNYGYRF